MDTCPLIFYYNWFILGLFDDFVNNDATLIKINKNNKITICHFYWIPLSNYLEIQGGEENIRKMRVMEGEICSIV